MKVCKKIMLMVFSLFLILYLFNIQNNKVNAFNNEKVVSFNKVLSNQNDVVFKTEGYIVDNIYYYNFVSKNDNGEYFLYYIEKDINTDDKMFSKEYKLKIKNFYKHRFLTLNKSFLYIEENNKNEITFYTKTGSYLVKKEDFLKEGQKMLDRKLPSKRYVYENFSFDNNGINNIFLSQTDKDLSESDLIFDTHGTFIDIYKLELRLNGDNGGGLDYEEKNGKPVCKERENKARCGMHNIYLRYDLSNNTFKELEIKDLEGNPINFTHNSSLKENNKYTNIFNSGKEKIFMYVRPNKVYKDLEIEIYSIKENIGKLIFHTKMKGPQKMDISIKDPYFKKTAWYKENFSNLYIYKDLDNNDHIFWSFVKEGNRKTLVYYNKRNNNVIEYKDLEKFSIYPSGNNILLITNKRIGDSDSYKMYELGGKKHKVLYENINSFKFNVLYEVFANQKLGYFIEGGEGVYHHKYGIIKKENKNENIVFSPNGFFYLRYNFVNESLNSFKVNIGNKDITQQIKTQYGQNFKNIKNISNVYISDDGFYTMIITEDVKIITNKKKGAFKIVQKSSLIIGNLNKILLKKNLEVSGSYFISYLKNIHNFLILDSNNNTVELFAPYTKKYTQIKNKDLIGLLDEYNYNVLLNDKIKSLNILGEKIGIHDFNKKIFFFSKNKVIVYNLNTGQIEDNDISNILDLKVMGNYLYLLTQGVKDNTIKISLSRNLKPIESNINDIELLEYFQYKNKLITNSFTSEFNRLTIQKSFVPLRQLKVIELILNKIENIIIKKAGLYNYRFYLDQMFYTFYLDFVNNFDKTLILDNLNFLKKGIGILK